MPRDPDTAEQEDLLEQIHRFPELFPLSMGGLLDDEEYAKLLAEQLPPNGPPFTEEEHDELDRAVGELYDQQFNERLRKETSVG